MHVPQAAATKLNYQLLYILGAGDGEENDDSLMSMYAYSRRHSSMYVCMHVCITGACVRVLCSELFWQRESQWP